MKFFKLKPAQKDYLWGGSRLKDQFNKDADYDIVAETWELSAHKDGVSVIDNGPLKGKTFTEYLEMEGPDVIGADYDKDRFPILNKFIDASKALSIQVHPKDEYALANEDDYGKTEMWYVIDADPGSYLYYGVKEEISKEDFAKSIEDGSLLDKLNKVEVKKGDVFFIEAGTIHAIGEGIMIYEVQQNSNVTYRVYDYKRKDKDGKERELHVDKAIEVSNLSPNKEYAFDNNNPINPGLTRLAKSNYFDVLKGEAGSDFYQVSPKTFQALTFIQGSGRVCLDNHCIDYRKGDTFFIPAQENSYKIEGDGEFIISSLPELN